MANFPFSFKVLGYNYDEKYYFTDTGFGIASSYAHAAKVVEEYFGDELISIKDLSLYEESPLILCSEQEIIKYQEDRYKKTKCDKEGVPIDDSDIR